MRRDTFVRKGLIGILGGCLCAAMLGGCELLADAETLPPEPSTADFDYIVGPGDSLDIFVWRNPELSRTAIVRPDGKITVPLVEDLVVTGKTTTQLAREIEVVLGKFVRDPLVTVMVSGFIGVSEEQVRVLGEATNPTSIPYRAGMSMLDLIIAVGGLTEFAAGNKAQLIRTQEGKRHQVTVRLEDLIKDADLTADVKLAPGDVVIIPEAWF